MYLVTSIFKTRDGEMEAAWLVVRKHHLWFYSFGIKCDGRPKRGHANLRPRDLGLCR